MSRKIEWPYPWAPHTSCPNRPWFILVKDDKVMLLEEVEKTDRTMFVDVEEREFDGYFCYWIVLAAGVRAIFHTKGWERRPFVAELAEATGRPVPRTWKSLAVALGVPIESAKEFFRRWRPEEAEVLE